MSWPEMLFVVFVVLALLPDELLGKTVRRLFARRAKKQWVIYTVTYDNAEFTQWITDLTWSQAASKLPIPGDWHGDKRVVSIAGRLLEPFEAAAMHRTVRGHLK